jgi:hypothetical protein
MRAPKLIQHDGVMQAPELKWPSYWTRLTFAWVWLAISVLVSAFGPEKFALRPYLWHVGAMFCGLAPALGLIILSWRIKAMDERERAMVWSAFMTGNSAILAFGCFTWLFSNPTFVGQGELLSQIIGNIAPLTPVGLPPLGYLFSITVLQVQRSIEWLEMEKGNGNV